MPSQSRALIAAGVRLADRYELVAPIASGGMAQVWRATDTILGRSVAVKILHPHLATDRAFLTRFRREAVAAARLSHPSIVAIYDTMTEPEAIVMELVSGRTLRTVLDDVSLLSPADGIDLGIQIADALDIAHEAGIVHRDIKPSNILICPDRRVMVTDFGIAKAGEDTDLTVTGTLLGTAKYLSPEQVRGDPVDPRSDLYSLGTVLFEALTGRAPFRGDTDAATALARLRHDPPRLRHLNPDLPQSLDNVVQRLLERNPDDRFHRALDVRAALSGVQLDPTLVTDRTLLVAEPIYLPPDSDQFDEDEDDFESFIRSERSWILPAFLVLLVAIGLVVAGLLLSRSPIAGTVLPSLGSRSENSAGDSSDDDVVGTDTTLLTPINEIVEPSIAGVVAIDPEGDDEEGSDTVGLAFDGDGDTFWRTDRYKREGFAGLKSGVGLVIDLGGNARLHQVGVDTKTDGWSVSFYVGADFSGQPGTWGEAILSGEGLSGSQTFDLGGATATRLLVWFTNPGLSADGADDDGDLDHRLEVTEIRVS